MFESFRDWDLKDTGSCDELGAGAPVVQSKGTTRESLIEGAKQKHTQREGLYDLRIRCRGVGHNVGVTDDSRFPVLISYLMRLHLFS